MQQRSTIIQTMDQFSVDLTRALEETSRTGGIRAGRWTQRRRTRSTGNLPCAPQPTEDSSSSPTDAPNEMQNPPNQDGLTNSMLSDSDDRHDIRLSLKSRHAGNFESDSLNENFSPARFFRQNARRKRKFKRMAVEYETTPSTPGAAGENASSVPTFPISGAVKKRVLKHTTQENYRANLFFFGKRKRSYRDRYYDHHDHFGKQHSSSVPRQRDFFTSKNSYQEHKTRTKSFSSAAKPSCERILPLNKNIVSKIERISSQQQKKPEISAVFTFTPVIFSSCNKTITSTTVVDSSSKFSNTMLPNELSTSVTFKEDNIDNEKPIFTQTISENDITPTLTTVTIQKSIQISSQQKPESFETKFMNSVNPLEQIFPKLNSHVMTSTDGTIAAAAVPIAVPIPKVKTHHHHHHHHHTRKHKSHRFQIRAQFQFDDPNSMECSNLNDFLSSSSLSSSDSEADETNESDREGDDELTDWPGNEAMINFASKNDFKRKSGKKSTLPQIKSDDYAPGGDDDTLMSGDEVISPPIGINYPLPLLIKPAQSQPITIASNPLQPSHQFRFPVKQIESEMSGETSNHFLSSPPCKSEEIREIRAGCRRIREERPGFSIMTSVNERLARFLQDARQTQIRLPDLETHEHDSLRNLAKLYSLLMTVENGCAVLTKTSNTTQSVEIDQPNFGSRFFSSDYKRRCYDGRSGSVGSCSQGTNDSLNADILDDDLDDVDEIESSGTIILSSTNTHMKS